MWPEHRGRWQEEEAGATLLGPVSHFGDLGFSTKGMVKHLWIRKMFLFKNYDVDQAVSAAMLWARVWRHPGQSSYPQEIGRRARKVDKRPGGESPLRGLPWQCQSAGGAVQ